MLVVKSWFSSECFGGVEVIEADLEGASITGFGVVFCNFHAPSNSPVTFLIFHQVDFFFQINRETVKPPVFPKCLSKVWKKNLKTLHPVVGERRGDEFFSQLSPERFLLHSDFFPPNIFPFASNCARSVSREQSEQVGQARSQIHTEHAVKLRGDREGPNTSPICHS